MASSSDKSGDAPGTTTPQAPAGAVELEEDALTGVAGGVDGGSLKSELGRRPSKWKMASLDGKGNDVLTEEITIVAENVTYKPG